MQIQKIYIGFYFHEGNAVRYALCLYTPVTTEQPAMIMDSLTGKAVLLNKVDAKQILSNREKEILRMIDAGMSSKEIAAMLNISIYTVSRHRQNILEKLHAKNSSHACTEPRTSSLYNQYFSFKAYIQKTGRPCEPAH